MILGEEKRRAGDFIGRQEIDDIFALASVSHNISAMSFVCADDIELIDEYY